MTAQLKRKHSQRHKNVFPGSFQTYLVKPALSLSHTQIGTVHSITPLLIIPYLSLPLSRIHSFSCDTQQVWMDVWAEHYYYDGLAKMDIVKKQL